MQGRCWGCCRLQRGSGIRCAGGSWL